MPVQERLELEKAKQIKLETARRAAEKKIQQAEAQEAQERLYKLLGPTHPPTKYVIEGVDDVDDEIEDVIKEVIGSWTISNSSTNHYVTKLIESNHYMSQNLFNK